jgi:hypothetical protein
MNYTAQMQRFQEELQRQNQGYELNSVNGMGSNYGNGAYSPDSNQQQVGFEQSSFPDSNNSNAVSPDAVDPNVAGNNSNNSKSNPFILCSCFSFFFIAGFVLTVIGLVLFPMGIAWNNRTAREDGCKIEKIPDGFYTSDYYNYYYYGYGYQYEVFSKICVFIPSPTGYGYVNPEAMNITTPIASDCLIVQPHVDCNNSSDVVTCHAQVEYISSKVTDAKTVQVTNTSFSSTSLYYQYQVNETKKCYTDPMRPDLVSLFPYVYPNPRLYERMVIAGAVIFSFGAFLLTVFTVLSFIAIRNTCLNWCLPNN